MSYKYETHREYEKERMKTFESHRSLPYNSDDLPKKGKVNVGQKNYDKLEKCRKSLALNDYLFYLTVGEYFSYLKSKIGPVYDAQISLMDRIVNMIKASKSKPHLGSTNITQFFTKGAKYQFEHVEWPHYYVVLIQLVLWFMIICFATKRNSCNSIVIFNDQNALDYFTDVCYINCAFFL